MNQRFLRNFWKTLAALLTFAAAVPAVAVDTDPVRAEPKLVILDIELTGDLGGPQFAAEHEARLRLESDTYGSNCNKVVFTQSSMQPPPCH